ncbi:MAG: ABC transporter permease subunit [Bacillota bacterium]
MRNAMIPILGGLPTASGLAISNLIVIEYLANIGGMGRMLGFEFIEHNAVPNLIVSVVICLAAFFVLIDGLVDIGLFWLDPKAREARHEALASHRANRFAWWRALPAGLRRQAAALRAWFAGLGAPRPRPAPAEREPVPWRWYGRRLIAAYRWNLPLILGTAIVGSMVAVAILDPWIRPKDPYAIQALIYIDARNFWAPPFPPGNGFIFGSDEMGRDILSRVIHGTRFTLMFVALIVPLRILIALPIGLAAGWLKGAWEWWVSRIATIFGAVPMLILSATLVPTVFLPTRITAFDNPSAPAPAEASKVLLLHVAILVLLGWPRLAESIRLMTRELSHRAFIEGAHAVGAPSWRVMRRHILPHLLPALAVIGAAEVAWLMMLMTQLGVFNITLGGNVMLESLGATAIFPDWSHMLARPVRYLWARQWILITPAVAFFIAILGFNLLAEGLRRASQRLAIPTLPDRPSQVSPRAAAVARAQPTGD